MNEAYWKWIRNEAAHIHSNGCSHATELAHHCCLEHDLAFYYGRDPRHARSVGWKMAQPIGFRTANARFRQCLPWWLKYRWVAVSIGGWGIWKRHRKERP